MLAPGIAELSVQPYLALNPQDASDLGLTAGDEVQLRLRPQADVTADGWRTPPLILPLKFSGCRCASSPSCCTVLRDSLSAWQVWVILRESRCQHGVS